MILIKEKLITSVKKHYQLNKEINFKQSNLEEFLKFLYDKRNAALGDSLINFIYSCTKSIVKNETTGLKISDTILLNGFSSSKLSKWLKLKGNKKVKANAIEALILYLWLVHDFKIEEMIMNLMLKLEKNNFNTSSEEKTYASFAFSSLFDSFDKLLVPNN